MLSAMPLKNRFLAQDRISISSRRVVTDEGYLRVPGVMARTGIQEYKAFELGLDKAVGMSPMQTVRLYRPPEEVFAPDSMASFEGVPITIDHPKDGVNDGNWQRLSKGDVRGITEDSEPLPDGERSMSGELTIRSRDAIKLLNSGKKTELSNGYSFELDLTPGMTPSGKAYDGVQRKIRGNHLALVDAARCGSACRIADSSSKGDKVMKTIVVDGIPVEVDDTAAAVIEKLQKQVVAAETATKTATDAATAEKDALVKAHDTAMAAVQAELETVRKDVMTPAARDAMVADWAKLIGDAKVLVPELVTDGKTCHAIRQEVIEAVTGKDSVAKGISDAILAGVAVADASPEVLKAAFGALRAAHKPETKPAGDSKSVADAMLNKSSGDSAAPLSGRAAMMARAAAQFTGSK